MAAILKALSTVMIENRRNKAFTENKELKMREYIKDTYFSLIYYIHVICLVMFPPSLTSCIQTVDVTSKQYVKVTQMIPRLA